MAIGRKAVTVAVERPRDRQDPVRRAARRLPPGLATALAKQAHEEVAVALDQALREAGADA
jgi:hypothetical protein